MSTNSLTRREVDALIEENGGELSLSAVVAAMAAKRDEYDLAAVDIADREHGCEGELEIDDNALTSRDDDDEGCYVMAWVWVPKPDGDGAA